MEKEKKNIEIKLLTTGENEEYLDENELEQKKKELKLLKEEENDFGKNKDNESQALIIRKKSLIEQSCFHCRKKRRRNYTYSTRCYN